MYSSLDDKASERFSPAWREALKEIGGEDFFGLTLRNKIQGIIQKNQLTPTVAADELDKLRERMEKFQAALHQTVVAFATFRIGDEKLAPGECEIGILIPRHAVDNRLIEFSAELKELTFILNTFAELATAIERLVALYKSLLEIRKIQVDLRKQGVPDDAAKGIEGHANALMEQGIAKLSVEIVEQFYTRNDDGRKNELTTAVKFSLNNIANRIDRGYNIEVRCEPLTGPAENEPQNQETNKALAAVLKAAANMQFLKLEGDPILRLPEKKKGKEKEDDDEKKAGKSKRKSAIPKAKIEPAPGG
jgi:hypothetical protein